MYLMLHISCVEYQTLNNFIYYQKKLSLPGHHAQTPVLFFLHGQSAAGKITRPFPRPAHCQPAMISSLRPTSGHKKHKLVNDKFMAGAGSILGIHQQRKFLPHGAGLSCHGCFHRFTNLAGLFRPLAEAAAAGFFKLSDGSFSPMACRRTTGLDTAVCKDGAIELSMDATGLGSTLLTALLWALCRPLATASFTATKSFWGRIHTILLF